MRDIFLNFSIGIVSGTFAGLLSSMLIYLFSERRNKIRKIIEYAELTADKAYQIMDEIEEYSEEKSNKTLRLLLKKEVRRSFPGSIIDKTILSKRLQQGIAGCNNAIHKVDQALDSDNISSNLFHASNEINEALIELWNATTEFDITEDRRIEKYKKSFLIGIPIIIAIFLAVLILATL